MAMTDLTTARPGLAAGELAQQLAAADLVSRLRDILGARLVAYIAGQADANMLNVWISGDLQVPQPVVATLRSAFVSATILRDVEGKNTVQSWFLGINPQLSDRSPAQLLREGPLAETASQVEGAAQAAASIG